MKEHPGGRFTHVVEEAGEEQGPSARRRGILEFLANAPEERAFKNRRRSFVDLVGEERKAAEALEAARRKTGGRPLEAEVVSGGRELSPDEWSRLKPAKVVDPAETDRNIRELKRDLYAKSRELKDAAKSGTRDIKLEMTTDELRSRVEKLYADAFGDAAGTPVMRDLIEMTTRDIAHRLKKGEYDTIEEALAAKAVHLEDQAPRKVSVAHEEGPLETATTEHEEEADGPRIAPERAEEIAMDVAADVLAGTSAAFGDAYAAKYDEGDIEEAKLQAALNPEWGEDELRRHMRSRMEAQRDSIAGERSDESVDETAGDTAPEPREDAPETDAGGGRGDGEPPIEHAAAKGGEEPPRGRLKDVFSKRAVAEAVLLQGGGLDVNKRGNPRIHAANIGAINECVADIEREAAESGRTFEEVAYSRLAPDSHMAAVLRGEEEDKYVKFEDATGQGDAGAGDDRAEAPSDGIDESQPTDKTEQVEETASEQVPAEDERREADENAEPVTAGAGAPEGERGTERTAEEVAAENLRLAAEVERLMGEAGLEANVEEMRAHDPVRIFLREKMGLTDDEIDALNPRYRTVTGLEKKEGGEAEALVTEVDTLHDLMAVRGEMPPENRAEYDSQTVPEDESGEYVWSRVGIILPKEFWTEVLSENGKYHEHEGEFLDLLYERIQKDLEPDGYATAKMEELKARKPEAAPETAHEADTETEADAREPESSTEPVSGDAVPDQDRDAEAASVEAAAEDPEKLAAENRAEAASVPAEFFSIDAFYSIRRRLKDEHDPLLKFARETLGVEDPYAFYDAAVMKEAAEGEGGAERQLGEARGVYSYDDMLRARAAMTDDERREVEEKCKEGSFYRPTKAAFTHELVKRIMDGDLSEHKDAYLRLVAELEGELAKDEVATEAKRLFEQRERNWKGAESVPAEFESDDRLAERDEHDPVRRELRRYGLTDDEISAFGLNYRTPVDLKKDENPDNPGGYTANIASFLTYHELLRRRAGIPEGQRVEGDALRWKGDWQKIALFAKEDLWKLFEDGGRLAEHKGEFYALLDMVKNEFAPDTYAEWAAEEARKKAAAGPGGEQGGDADSPGIVAEGAPASGDGAAEQGGKPEANALGGVEDRASQFGIRAEDLNTIEGWDRLSEGQQKLCLENLGQIMLGRIRDEAKVRHSEKVRNETFLKRLYLGARKQYDLPALEQGLAKKVMRGGIAMHGELLKQLARGAEASGIGAHEEKGRLVIDFAAGVAEEGALTPEEKGHMERFNRLANQLAFSSYEKGVPLDEEKLAKRKYTGEGPVDPKNVMAFIHNAGVTADKVIDFLNVGRRFDRREVERQLELRRQYDAERSRILDIRYRTSGKQTEAERRFDALEYVNKLESAIELNRFVTLEKGATAKIAKIADKAIWKRALSGVATERGLILASGFALRSVTTSLFGAMGGVLFAAPAIGRMSSRMREQNEMRERDRLARHGEAEPVDLRHEEEALAKRSAALEELKQKLEGQMAEDTRRETSAEIATIERQMQNIRKRIAEKRSYLNKDFADATNLGEKLGRLSSSVRQDADAMDRLLAEKETAKDAADAQRIEGEVGVIATRLEKNIRKLKARQAFTERKLEEGKVNFGGVRSEERKIARIDRHIEEIRSEMRATKDKGKIAEMELAVRHYEAKKEALEGRLGDFRRNAGAIRLSNQLDLSQSLGFASAVAGLAEGLERSDDDKYRDQRLKEKLEKANARVAAERAGHMSSAVKKGMVISGAFAAAGYGIRAVVDAYLAPSGRSPEAAAVGKGRSPATEMPRAEVREQNGRPVAAEAVRPQAAPVEPVRAAEESAAALKDDEPKVVASAAPASTASVQTGGVRAPVEFKLPVESDRPAPEIHVPDMDEEARERVSAAIKANPAGEPQPIPSAEAAPASAVDAYRALSERSGELRTEWGRTNAKLLDPRLGSEERAAAMERLGELDREISEVEGKMGEARTKALEEIDRKLATSRADSGRPSVESGEPASGEEAGAASAELAGTTLDEGGMPVASDRELEAASAEAAPVLAEEGDSAAEPETFFREVADREPGAPIPTGSVQTGSVSTGGIETSAGAQAEAVPDPGARFGPKSIEAFVDKNDGLQLTHYRNLTFLDQSIARYRTPDDIVGVQGNLEALNRTFDRQPMLFQDLAFKRIAGITRRIEEEYRTDPASFGDTAKAYLRQMRETLKSMEKAQAATKAAFDQELRRFGHTSESYAARIRSNPDMTVKNVLRLQVENKDDKFLAWLVKEFNLRQYPVESREAHVDTVVSSKFRVLSTAEKQAKSLLAGLRGIGPRRPGA